MPLSFEVVAGRQQFSLFYDFNLLLCLVLIENMGGFLRDKHAYGKSST